MLHEGDARTAWQAFHRFARADNFAVPPWARQADGGKAIHHDDAPVGAFTMKDE
jgi:hypothetical protein